MWSQTAAKASVKNYAYHFTGPILPVPPFLGGITVCLKLNRDVKSHLTVAHGQEIPFVFETLPAGVATAEQLELSAQISDYWISFATSKDPNDGKGTQREHFVEPAMSLADRGNRTGPPWSEYTTSDPVRDSFR